MPAESRIIGAARSDLNDDALPRTCAPDGAAPTMSPARDLDQQVGAGGSASGCTTRGSTPPSGEAGARSAQRSGRAAAERVRVFYLATSPDLYGPICRNLARRRAGHDRLRRVVLEKPIGHDLASARAINDAVGRGVHRAADLPHRPLSRQGDGAEPAGAALRQLDLRAAVERRRDRPRADHGRRDRGRGRPRRLLRPLRRAARHGAEPPAAAPLPAGDGAARLARRRRGARREAEGAARAAPDRAARGAAR